MELDPENRPLDSETGMSELLESEVWGPGSRVRRYSIFSKFDDPKRVEKTRSGKKLRNMSGEPFSRGRNEGVPPTHVVCRRAQEVLSGWNNQATTKRAIPQTCSLRNM